MQTTIAQNQETATQAVNPQVVIGNFGDGRYSQVMTELYRDTQRLLGFSKAQAHATGTRLGIELGRLSSGQAKVSYGSKVSKDGFRTVKEVASIKTKEVWPITIAVICSGLDTLRGQGLEVVENTIADILLESVNEAAKRLIASNPVENKE